MRDITRIHSPKVTGQAYGIEVELENVLLGVDQRGWDAVGDGSLRGGGVEFLTPPVSLATAREMLRDLYRMKHEHGWTGGPRCGIHIHMDMNSRTVKQAHAFVVAYACVEPALFAMCGPEREANIFCVPWYRAQNGLTEVRNLFWRGSRDALLRLRRAQSKYTAMYLEPLARFGTMEFRGAPVYENVGDMLDLLTAFSQLLHSTLEANPADIVDQFSADPDAALAQFMPICGGSGALIDGADSAGIAASLVRTKPLPPKWEFLGLNTGDTAPRENHRGQILEELDGAGNEYRLENARVRLRPAPAQRRRR
jgi:hypothetical protein